LRDRFALVTGLTGVLAGFAPALADAQTATPAEPAPAVQSAPSATVPAPVVNEGPIAAWFDRWAEVVAAARASQPEWASPVVTSTALLENRLRLDAAIEHSGNGSDTYFLPYGAKSFDLIVGPAQEIQIGAPLYEIRTSGTRHGKALTAFADWPGLRFKQILAASPEGAGDYVLAAWMQLQLPTGVSRLTNNAVTLLPALGYGKGWGPFVIQGTLGGVIPTAHEGALGAQVTNNIALQYRVWDQLWPQIEVNWTWFAGGPNRGKNEVFLTPGMVLGRVNLTERLRFSIGLGYQRAVAPTYRPSPLLPAYNSAWLATTLLSF
jgi:hypothetical protein